jgi:two-component system, LytTR family, response regulator
MFPEKIKALIVDDMPPAREGMRLLLEHIGNVSIVGEVGDVDSAFQVILIKKPHLVFLDVNLPKKDGFSLLDELKKHPEIDLDVIFVSGHREYAIRSFDYYPFQYLLKPVATEKLREVLEKYTEKKFGHNLAQRIDELKNITKRLYIKSEDGFAWIDYDDILFLKASRNYTEVFLKNSAIELITENIGSIEKQLPKEMFYKTHRSYIINVKKVYKILRKSLQLVLKDNPFKESPLISKDNIAQLINYLEKNPQ